MCLLLAPLRAQADDTDPAAALQQAESEFQQQQYRRVVGLLKPVLHPSPRLDSPEDQHRARELLAASHWFLKEFGNARQEFQFLLLKRPGFQLDTFIYPSDLIDFLEQLRATLVSQGLIPPLEDTKKPKPDTEKPPTVMRVTQVVQTRSRSIAFMPFGMAQFEYGANGWGTFFATSQGLAALGNIGSYVALYALDVQGITEGREEVAIAMASTGAALIALYLWGVIDGNLRHEPVSVVSITTEELSPKEAAEIRTPQPQLAKPGDQTVEVPTPVAPGGSPR